MQHLLTKEVQSFIDDHIDTVVDALALKKNPFPEIEWIDILHQIQSKQKAKLKLPTWYNHDNILYPHPVSIEQTSSEPLAQFKASLISGTRLIDLTGGFGVDCFYFSQQFNEVVHCEHNTTLSDLVKHNYEQLNRENITCLSGDSTVILDNLSQYFDWIYIDPARRADNKQKVFMLQDCVPNVPENLEHYFSFTNQILIKTAPLLDIHAGLSELQNVKKVIIVAFENEVKELLWILEKDFSDDVIIEAVTIDKHQNISSYAFSVTDATFTTHSLPKSYVYEPNSALMKTGNFNAIADRFGLKKLHKHSHLYTSDELIDFPGRRFKILEIIPAAKKEIKQYLENKKWNITVRNFPMKVEEIRKKYKIKDGGNQFAFFTTDLNNQKIVLLCEKI
ncbi:class I SAM-dependent methyltransferase [Myroides ceti]|uniref:Class I SAM-dependent methyltransferase n=1 Tax=Paenimyroides ceti TaxID=395087 RepID=A0ABT8CUN4_9FLAO|nr:class I SAM-dependent methyltransferase [Paenimyroides ceti]MDN3706897.1 class I SAM-dependent methyltransferase [Paenimyroides ceti]